MIRESYCSYKTSMMLKWLGFNEDCQSMYETAIRHNGKDLSFDDELDLKSAGKGKEIEYEKGGWTNNHYNTNRSDWMPRDCCSRPTLALAMKWLREVKGYQIEVRATAFPKWIVWVAVLGKPNTKDGLINAVQVRKKFATYEEAAEAGLAFQLKILLDANKQILKHADDPEYFAKMQKELEESGFDFSDAKK